ncbi:hypothetical protein N7509_013632 [Penicillium cosmopolitanum]|uniref:Telomere-associated protein Rif1 N-terminal domain-containing protein n=1 Tax=Penicillium cosmopolitanum TaxID=1131564 RepID=A0A9W9SDQ4_9EURO|nr:uncharacterized protein N7509_013632 [Penicillium cosmopolitanum]KAJ5376746.1 hypothetical protein N7509_013632 [Penicillium cosmopolitanum]
MVETLGPLPARPPTPPRPGPRIEQNQPVEDAPITAQTPGDTPQPAHSSRVPPSSRASKRVTFSPWLQTEIHSPWTAKSADFKDSPIQGSPLPSEIRPFKSILKETGSPIPVWSPNVDKFTTESLDMLLESVTQQLAGESLTSRLDAYMQFFGALRTYDGLPAGRDVAEKLGLITGFIQRDVTRDLVNSAPLDTNLANQALKLSAAFVWHSDISAQLSEEFKVFIVEQAITSLQEAKVPKSVLTHYMSILSTQNFGLKIMTNARVTRLLSALQDVTNHVTGKAIALHRLSIYHKLFAQSKSSFVSQASLWMEQLIFGLLHPMKDTRLKAISLGFQITMTMGPNMTLSKSIRELFDRSLEKDRKLVTEVRDRMSRMISTVESGVHIPQIWSTIILLLRSKSRSLDQWEHFKEWVLVLQKCFNCSEPAIKAQAILGWNRFVFAVGPTESTSRSLLKMLGKPVISQFERKKSDRSAVAPTQLALASYHNLLYYAFRPSPPHQYLDLVWEEYISIPATGVFATSPALSDRMSRVIANLLSASQAKVWAETRINDSSKIEAEELPSVDPRWVRSRAASIVRAFESILKSSVWHEESVERSNVAIAWSSFCNALALASNKEITPSGESMHAVASVLGLLKRVWSAGPPSLNATGDNCSEVFLERFRFLSTTIIGSLGGINFTEKLLIKTMEEIFETDSTPFQRDTAPGTAPDSPILHLLRAISSNSPSTSPTSSYIELVRSAIEAACKTKISRGSRLELLQQCANLTGPHVNPTSSSSTLSDVVWRISAKAAADALQSFPIESSRERDGSVSRDYENVTKILADVAHIPTAYPEWACLLESFVRVVRTEKGNHSLATLIVEPIAESLASLAIHNTYLPVALVLSHSMSIPFMQDETLGIDGISHQVPLFPHKFIELVKNTLQLAYDSFDPSQIHALPIFLESLTSFLGSGNSSFRGQVLESLQSPLGPWIKDEHCKVDLTHGADSRTLTACRALSSSVINILYSVPDEVWIHRKFETIICAGLESAHHSRFKQFVEFWEFTASSLEPAIWGTPITKSLERAMAKWNVSAAQQMENLQNSDAWPSHKQDKTDNQPKNKRRVSQNTQSRAANITSSTVVGFEHQSSVETTESNEPQLPANTQPEASEEKPLEDVPTIQPQANRREMFRMIESIRSSSPANTPGKSGYDTPVHLRRFQASNTAAGIPLTPTLAPTENEEGFIGSSPTPATRDPTPAANKEAPILTVPDVAMMDASDLPSSPPEVTSRSPSPQKRNRQSRSQRRRSAKIRKAMLLNSSGEQSGPNSPAKPDNDTAMDSASLLLDQKDDSKENDDASQVDERPPSRRTRAALGQSIDNSQNPVPEVTVETPGKSKEVPATQTPRSKSASKKKRKKSASRSPKKNSQNQQTADEASTTLVPPEHNLDSSSEEMETQIASQLEQDLESAVDLGGQINLVEDIQTGEEQLAPQASRKRKREEDSSGTQSHNAKERRRSTRLTATKDETHVDLEQPTLTASLDYLPDPGLPEVSQDTIAKQETVTPRRSTRSSQRKEEPIMEEFIPATQVSETQEPIQEPVQEPVQEPTEENVPAPAPAPAPASSKRSRKSLRLDDQPSTPVPEEGPPTRSRPLRSRKSRSTRNDSASQDQHVQPESQAGDSQPSGTQPNSQAMVPDSVVTEENSAVQDVPLVSTEEVTDSQMTDADASAQPTTTTNDIQTMDIDVIPEEAPAISSQPITSVFTAEVQTKPSPIPDMGNAETSLTSSLQKVLDEMKTATLGPEALRQVDDLLFNIRVAAHDASRRI